MCCPTPNFTGETMEQPAFPTYFTGEHAVSMTLRDYFAAKAMQAILSEDPDYHTTHEFIDLADFSYRCADAMLRERG